LEIDAMKSSTSRRTTSSLLLPLLGGLLVAAGPIPIFAVEILINNGLAPPNPANVINDAGYDVVWVQNVGCNSMVEYPCASPSAATTVAIEPGGSVSHLLQVYESAFLAMSGGSVEGMLIGYDSSSITMSDGWVGLTLRGEGTSSVTMSGGWLDGRLTAEDSSSVTLSGGSVGGTVLAHDWASMTISSGRVESISNPDLTVSVLSSGYSSITVFGGWFRHDLEARGSSTITIIGSDFMVDGVPVPYGELTALTGTLTGTLASGETLNNEFCQGGGSCSGSYCGGGASCDGTVILAPVTDCSDHMDNDGDGKIDYPADPGCLHPTAYSEDSACQDGNDNDSDGMLDGDVPDSVEFLRS
jgi:hypothetical protein